MNSRPGPLDHFHAVILAGGRGTRFWPQSRARRPKQFLNVLGQESLLQQTLARLGPIAPPERTWILTNQSLRKQVLRQLPGVPRRQVIAEPVQRNTAPAIALAAHLLEQQDPDAVMGVFPSDHVIAKTATFHRVLRRAAKAALRGNLVVLGIEPKWPETGYGYIEFPPGTLAGSGTLQPVVRFREKPRPAAARRYLKAGNFFWNSGMFLWQARTILRQIERFLPATADALSKLPPLDSRQFSASLRRHYPACDDISIDYGVLERAGEMAGLPCPDFGWNDVGSWEAVYQLLPKDKRQNVLRSRTQLLSADGNYVDSNKLVALVGVQDLIVVDTPDALLIVRRQDSQRVAELVKALETGGLTDLL